MESTKKKLLIIGPNQTVTIVRNADMLRNHFTVKLIRFRNKNKIHQLLDIFNILFGVLWADVTLSHFATEHAFWTVLFTKILRKKSIVIVAGFEVAKVPEINYGVMLNPVKALLVKHILKHADRIFVVSEFTRKETLNYVSPDKDISVVYGCNAIDCDHFKFNGEKENLVLTVGHIVNYTIKRKGFKTFFKAAEYLPDIRFMLLGKHLDRSVEYLKSIAPPNVNFGFDADLLKWYQKAKVYCQLSYYESFGVCLVEAMACECVPVVTNRGALPEVAGNVGFCVQYGDAKMVANVIKKAMKSDRAGAARERVKGRFSVEAKRQEFINEIEKVLI